MKQYKVILFDLDGTLSDPGEGITKSVQYALSRMGIEEPDLHSLGKFIGPPLQDSFADRYGFDESQTRKAIEYYRDRFKVKGIYENTLYESIPSLLTDFKEQGLMLAVATSKPTVFAVEILKYFNIDHFFSLITGSNLDGTRTSKTEIIEYVIRELNEEERSSFVMIGDRKHDIIGAKNTGIDSIAVTYGYGSFEELSQSEPTYLARDAAGIRDIVAGSGVT
ncbi:HAD family hydrolase [Lysinibacillus sphaericus]